MKIQRTKKMHLPMLVMLVVAVVTFPCVSNAGGGPSPNIPDADTIIKKCWDKSEKLRSTGNTNDARAGNLESALCLEKAIVDNAADFIDPSSLTRKQIAEKMKQIRFALGGFYWSLYNEHKGCPFPSCGTIFYSFHNSLLAHAYEEILRNVIDQRKQYKQ